MREFDSEGTGFAAVVLAAAVGVAAACGTEAPAAPTGASCHLQGTLPHGEKGTKATLYLQDGQAVPVPEGSAPPDGATPWSFSDRASAQAVADLIGNDVELTRTAGVLDDTADLYLFLETGLEPVCN